MHAFQLLELENIEMWIYLNLNKTIKLKSGININRVKYLIMVVIKVLKLEIILFHKNVIKYHTSRAAISILPSFVLCDNSKKLKIEIL